MSNWQIGIKFSYYKLKAKASQQYRGSVAKGMSTEKRWGSLFMALKGGGKSLYFLIPRYGKNCPLLHSYLCTLTSGCFQSVCVEKKSTTACAVEIYVADSESLSLTLSVATLF